MIRASAHPQSPFLQVLALCLAVLSLSGAIASAQGTAPTITSESSAAFVVGIPGSFTVTTAGSPVPSINENGALPSGVTLHDNGDGTAALGGTPTASGIFGITVTASNGVSPNATQSFTLNVNQTSAMTAARFLEQSSWGPTPATIAQVQTAGLQAYLKQQFSAPISTYTTPPPEKYFTLAELVPVQNNFFVNAMQGPDQLRQRVAFALSEIMVISAVGTNIKSATAFSLWTNMLQNDAFGNFFNLLNDVTLSPAWGPT